MELATLFWLDPLLPLAVFVLLACGLSRIDRFAAWLATGAVGLALIVATLGMAGVVQGAHPTVAVPWLTTGGRHIALALALDPLSAVLALLVSGIGFVVFAYAIAYMADDPRRGRFFAEMSLFVGAMLALVLASDLITLFIAWELVGLCSYLLIGFWFERPGVPAAATRAFTTTRIADMALLLGIVVLIGATGSSTIANVVSAASSGQMTSRVVLFAALLVVIGAAGKSAQLPFSGWLPDAMAGPAPVSALLHSATMVAAGVYLLARFNPLLVASSVVPGVVAWMGALTALFGALVALAQTDLKRLLAYSTLSQIGLMFLAIGAGSVLAGIGLLVSQALYKSTLFLAAGAVDHAVEGTAFERMGGLARRMPVTASVFAVAALALAGLPVTLALPAKDPALAAASGEGVALYVVALIASAGTALYSARAFGLAFLGPESPPASQARETGWGMRGPLVALAALIVIVLVVNSPVFGRPLETLLGGTTPERYAVTALALAIAVGGVAVGLLLRAQWPRQVVWPVLRPVAPLLMEEFGLRPLYRGVAAGTRLFASAIGAVDHHVFDALARGIASAAQLFVNMVGVVDRRVFDAFARRAANGLLAFVRIVRTVDLHGIEAGIRGGGQAILAFSGRARRLQTGMIGNYLLAIVLWGLAIVAIAAVALLRR